MKLLRWRHDRRHRLLCGLGTILLRSFPLDELALLRRSELLDHRVEAQLPLFDVVPINGHAVSSRAEFALVRGARRVVGCFPALGLRHGLFRLTPRRVLRVDPNRVGFRDARHRR